jgi:hypothetical protein
LCAEHWNKVGRNVTLLAFHAPADNVTTFRNKTVYSHWQHGTEFRKQPLGSKSRRRHFGTMFFKSRRHQKPQSPPIGSAKSGCVFVKHKRICVQKKDICRTMDCGIAASYEVRCSGILCRRTKSAAAAFYAVVRSSLQRQLRCRGYAAGAGCNAAEPWPLRNHVLWSAASHRPTAWNAVAVCCIMPQSSAAAVLQSPSFQVFPPASTELRSAQADSSLLRETLFRNGAVLGPARTLSSAA